MADPNDLTMNLSLRIASKWMEFSKLVSSGELSGEEAQKETNRLVSKIAEEIEFEARDIFEAVVEDRQKLLSGTWPDGKPS